MEKLELSKTEMQVIMHALYELDDNDLAAELHDKLVTEGFSRLEDIRGASLSYDPYNL